VLDPYITPVITGQAGNPPAVGASIGATWGIASGVHLDAQTAPLYVVPPRQGPGQHRLTLTGQFINTRHFKLGASLQTMLDTSGQGPLFNTVQPGLPVILGVSEHLRIDTGAQVPVTSGKIGFRVPLGVYVQLTERVHGGATSALSVQDVRDARATTTIPLGFTLGYSGTEEQANLGVAPYFLFTQFYTPAAAKVDPSVFSGGVIVDVPIKLP
jgi:hypothetical protein